MRKLNWKKKLVQALWLLIGIGTIVLLGAAMQKKEHKPCTDVKIEITGAEQNIFIDEKDVLQVLNSTGNVIGKDMTAINLRAMEGALEKNLWVKRTDMFFDNNQLLQVRIEEREPIARIFSVQGNSYYLDSSGLRLPLSEKFSARVPVFTNFPSDKPILSQPDSALLQGIVKLGRFIIADSFWMAQTAQIDITSHADFELIPTMGDHIVVLGNAEDLENKFNRLYSFYKQAWMQNGINKYEKLDVQYNGQVVAIRRGTGKVQMDSAKNTQVMNELAKQNATVSPDSAQVKPVVPAVIKVPAAIGKPKKLPVRAGNKNLMGIKQNKPSNTSLSIRQRTVQPVKQDKPSGKQQAKAVMGGAKG